MRSSQRGGIAFVYTALGLAVFLGMTALVVDMGRLYTKRAQAQNAADSAALAGSYELNNGTARAQAEAEAYAKRNGYNKEVPGTRVRTRVFTSGTGRVPNSIQVWVERDEPLYFLPAMAALLGSPSSTSRVGATATSEATFATDPINVPISLGSEYGATDGYANPSVFGQDGLYAHGDAYSPLLGNDGTANKGPSGDPHGADFAGYDYTLAIGADYVKANGTSEVQLEIFDPDTFVTDTADMLGSWDEQHGGRDGNYIPTSTSFTLLAPKLKEGDPDKVIATATYGDNGDSNLKWTTPDGFKFNTADHGLGNYTLRVKGGVGTAENGFQLRAGRPHEGLREVSDFATWKEKFNAAGAGNGTSVSSRGKAVFNFTRAGAEGIQLNLGLVPKNASKVLIDKFDTDVGFQSIEYSVYKADANGNLTTEKIAASLPAGAQGLNGQWAPTDKLDVPPGYETNAPYGAFWFATYKAGAFDTSNWLMSYEDPDTPPSKPGSVRLVD